MKTAKKLSWWVGAFGLWELLAPFILGYQASSAAMWDAVIIGVSVVILAVWAALTNGEATLKTLDWINALLGLWLVVAPFILSYSMVAAALWNDIIIGVVVIVLAAWAALVAGGKSTTQTGTQGTAA